MILPSIYNSQSGQLDISTSSIASSIQVNLSCLSVMFPLSVICLFISVYRQRQELWFWELRQTMNRMTYLRYLEIRLDLLCNRMIRLKAAFMAAFTSSTVTFFFKEQLQVTSVSWSWNWCADPSSLPFILELQDRWL